MISLKSVLPADLVMLIVYTLEVPISDVHFIRYVLVPTGTSKVPIPSILALSDIELALMLILLTAYGITIL